MSGYNHWPGDESYWDGNPGPTDPYQGQNLPALPGQYPGGNLPAPVYGSPPYGLVPGYYDYTEPVYGSPAGPPEPERKRPKRRIGCLGWIAVGAAVVTAAIGIGHATKDNAPAKGSSHSAAAKPSPSTAPEQSTEPSPTTEPEPSPTIVPAPVTPEGPSSSEKFISKARTMFYANVQGNSHDHDGVHRMKLMASLVRATNADVGTFTEFEPVNHAAAIRDLGDDYAFAYPGKDARNSVFYKKTSFELDTRYGTKGEDSFLVKYFDGHNVYNPVVFLRDKASGVTTAFIAFHNPSSHIPGHAPNQAGWRLDSTRRQSEYIARLQKTHPDIRVVMAGDSNNRGEWSAMLRKRNNMHGPIINKLPIDELMATPNVLLGNYRRIANKTAYNATDHHKVYTVTLDKDIPAPVQPKPKVATTPTPAPGSALGIAPKRTAPTTIGVAYPDNGAKPSRNVWLQDTYGIYREAETYLDVWAQDKHPAIVFDIDNTLIQTEYGHERVIPEALRFVREARAKGIRTFIDTGRTQQQKPGTLVTLSRDTLGFNKGDVCVRANDRVPLSIGKAACRQGVINRGYTIEAMFGNRATDFSLKRSQFKTAVQLRNYHNKLG